MIVQLSCEHSTIVVKSTSLCLYWSAAAIGCGIDGRVLFRHEPVVWSAAQNYQYRWWSSAINITINSIPAVVDTDLCTINAAHGARLSWACVLNCNAEVSEWSFVISALAIVLSDSHSLKCQPFQRAGGGWQLPGTGEAKPPSSGFVSRSRKSQCWPSRCLAAMLCRVINDLPGIGRCSVRAGHWSK